MHSPRRTRGFILGGLLAAALSLAAAAPAHAQVVFGKSALSGTSSANPTSLQFGPDGRLYVASQDGVIKAYTINRVAPNSYKTVATETIGQVGALPNRNDDGALNANVGGRLVTGLLVAGTAANPVLYVTSSDPRQGGGTGGAQNDLNLDTNSGIVSKLTRTAPGSWNHVKLVQGLPRSEENHTANGMALVGDTLLIAQGGNTNQGAPSDAFVGLPETQLSAAILAIDLSDDAFDDGGEYQLPRVGGGAGPFGGNDGTTATFAPPGSPVRVYAPGFRNPYDLVQTSGGKLYTIDNGGNAGWGDVPEGEGPGDGCTNALRNGGASERDSLHLIAGEGYYGGHPNPTRGQCDFLSSGTNTGAGNDEGSLVSFPSSTNGLTEYTASNFGGALQGDLLTVDYNFDVGGRLLQLDLANGGTTATTKVLLQSATTGGTGLDVTALGDGGIFPGTVWYGDVVNGTIYVLEPNDYKGATPVPCDLGKADSDGDGYTNADEQLNGTNICSPADAPPDFDGDRVSDRADTDDDNDKLLDKVDPFARDGANGLTTAPSLTFDWENDSPNACGLLDLGFTGLMTNGVADYLNQFDTANMTVKGAAGLVTIDSVPNGDAFLASNNQQYGFQFGVAARPAGGPFTIKTRLVAPFEGMTPADFQSMGLFVGTGDQDNYAKVVLGHSGGTIIEARKEVDGTSPPSAKIGLDLASVEWVDLYLHVDPAAATVQAAFQASNGAKLNAGAPLAVPAGWFTAPTGLAVGILSTSIGDAPPFTATWDFMQVYKGGGPVAPAARECPKAVPPSTPPKPPGGGGTTPPTPPPADTTKPLLTDVSLSRKRFKASRKPTSKSRRTGTRLSFELSEAATLRLKVQRAKSGRRVAGKCVAPRKASRRAKRCTRYVSVPGRALVTRPAGESGFRFQGWLGTKRLKPGSYRMALRAEDASGNRSETVKLKFKVKR